MPPYIRAQVQSREVNLAVCGSLMIGIPKLKPGIGSLHDL